MRVSHDTIQANGHARDLGEMPAFPHPADDHHPGMSYRQWLYGRVLTGVLAQPRTAFLTPQEAVGRAIATVDEMLNQLALREGQRRGHE